MLFQKNDGISRTERRAFKMLADALIFNEPLEHELTKDNVPLIAQKLRKEMIDLDTRSQRKMQIEVENLFTKLSLNDEEVGGTERRRTVLEKTEYELNSFLQEVLDTMSTPEGTFLLGFANSYANIHPMYEQYMYDKWGFTPRLAELHRKADHPFLANAAVRKNCFGTTLGLGSYFGVRGLKFDLAITADHPYVVVYLEKGTYLASLGLPKKLHNKIVERNGYKTYRPHPKDDLPHSFMVIHDFDRCMLYEVLENMEMLRLLSDGVDATRLPDTFESGFEVADAHKDVLQKTDWKLLATKLFPEITRSLLENREDWQHELDHIIPIRKRHHAENVLHKAMEEAQKETMYKNSDFRIGHSLLMDEFVMHGKAIVDFLREDLPFTDMWISDTIRRYFPVIKEHLERQTPEIREVCIGLLEKGFIKFIQKQKQKNKAYVKVRKRLAIFIRQGEGYRRKKNGGRASSSRNRSGATKTAAAKAERIKPQ